MATITAVNRNVITELLRGSGDNKLKNASQSQLVSSLQSVDIQKAADAFVKLPSQSSLANNLFDKMASEGLPQHIADTNKGYNGELIKNMLGMIYKDALPEDKAVFNKVFKALEKSDHKFSKDNKVSAELDFLFNKYGESALRKHVAEFEQHCRTAWEYHHTGFDGKVSDETIFNESIMACREVLENQIQSLKQPGQTWGTVLSSGAFVKASFAAISKTLRYHNADAKDPANGTPQRNAPQAPQGPQDPLGPQGHQPGLSDTGMHVPGGYGHGPITIQNTAQGGHATVNGGGAERSPASAADFGIALLNTPDEQLGNEKARLVEKFMDLYLGRAQNGGQDRFASYVEGVVQTPARHVAQTETLIASEPLQMAAEQLAMPAAQTATVTQSPVQHAQVINQPEQLAASKTAAAPTPQLATTDKDRIVKPDSVVIQQAPAEAGKNLQAAAGQVAAALSALLTEAESSPALARGSENPLAQPAQADSAALKTASQPAQASNVAQQDAAAAALQTSGNSAAASAVPASPASGNSAAASAAPASQASGISGSANKASRVQQLVQKFESLSTGANLRQNGVTNTAHLQTASTPFNSNAVTGQQRTSATDRNKSDFQPIKSAVSKFTVKVDQKPVYTTARTIDPFSRHSAGIKPSVTQPERKADAKDIEENNDNMGIL